MSGNNERMNLMFVHQWYTCAKCGRKYPDTILDIEAHVLTGKDVVCEDRKDCARYLKKRKKDAT